MLCFSKGTYFIVSTPLFTERKSAPVHFADELPAEFIVSGISAEDHFIGKLSKRSEKSVAITLAHLAEDDDIRFIRMLKLMTKAYSYLVLDEQLIGEILRHINKRIMVIQQGKLLYCKIVFTSSSL